MCVYLYTYISTCIYIKCVCARVPAFIFMCVWLKTKRCRIKDKSVDSANKVMSFFHGSLNVLVALRKLLKTLCSNSIRTAKKMSKLKKAVKTP